MDVAREAGVSRATVGFVLNRTPGQTISQETQARVVAAAQRLRYRPNEAARHLARGRTKLVLMVLPDWPLEHSMLRSIEAASTMLDQSGYTLITHTLTSGGRPLWETLSPDVVVGMVPFSEPVRESMRASGVMHILAAPSAAAASTSVHPPHAQGPALQVGHLAELGHRTVGYAPTADPRLRELQSERLLEASKAAAAAGVDLVVAGGDVIDALETWRRRGCTAVIGYNDETAARVLRASVLAGVDVPGDLSIIGHDDSPVAELLIPSLTSIKQDFRALGFVLAHQVLSTLGEESTGPVDEPQDVVSVVARDSTAPRSS